MKWSTKAMSETFLLSNIIPQDMRNNSGAWNRIEQQVREWAKRETSLYVITGPIYTEEGRSKGEEGRSAGGARYIGATKVRVPDFIYKVVLDETPPRKMIAFIAPNADTKKKPWQLTVTVDEVEEATGMDFFKTMPKEEQDRLERALDFKAWGIGDPRAASPATPSRRQHDSSSLSDWREVYRRASGIGRGTCEVATAGKLGQDVTEWNFSGTNPRKGSFYRGFSREGGFRNASQPLTCVAENEGR